MPLRTLVQETHAYTQRNRCCWSGSFLEIPLEPERVPVAAAFCHPTVPYFIHLFSYTPLGHLPTVWIELKSSGSHRNSFPHQMLPTTFFLWGDRKAKALEIRETLEVPGTVLPFLVLIRPLANSLLSPAGRSPCLIQNPDHIWPQFACNWGRVHRGGWVHTCGGLGCSLPSPGVRDQSRTLP